MAVRIPGNYQALSSFLRWWMKQVSSGDASFEVDLVNLDPRIQDAAREIVHACGRSCVGDEGFSSGGQRKYQTLVIGEVIFADVEKRIQKLDSFWATTE